MVVLPLISNLVGLVGHLHGLINLYIKFDRCSRKLRLWNTVSSTFISNLVGLVGRLHVFVVSHQIE